MNQSQQVTLSLASILELALGTEKTGVRVLPDYETGLILDKFTQKDTQFKVQFEEFDGTPLMYPKLWSYSEWFNSSTNWKRQKHRSHQEAVQRWIMEANIKIVTKFLINEMFMMEEKAKTTAYNLLAAKKLGVIRAMGIKHLVTKESELK